MFPVDHPLELNRHNKPSLCESLHEVSASTSGLLAACIGLREEALDKYEFWTYKGYV
jgi:hypothetical protein